MKCLAACLSLLACLSVAGSLRATDMWVVENTTNQVFRVNVNTLTATLVGNSGIDVVFGGIAFDPTGAKLYYWNSNIGVSNLYSVNQSTGAFSFIGSGTASGVDTIDINPATGEAIGWSVNSSLYNINLNNGATTFRVAVTPTHQGTNSAFNSSGTLYNLDSGMLYRVDVGTGIATAVGNTGVSPNLTFTDLGFNFSDGMLYAIPIGVGVTYPLYRFNPATGAGTEIGLINGLPPSPPSSHQITAATFAPLPEPSTLLLAAIGMAALAFARHRTLRQCGSGTI